MNKLFMTDPHIFICLEPSPVAPPVRRRPPVGRPPGSPGPAQGPGVHPAGGEPELLADRFAGALAVAFPDYSLSNIP